MPRCQRGILAEANLHSLYLLFSATPGFESELQHHIACLPAMVEDYADEYSEAELSAFVAVGSEYWDTLYPESRPAKLRAFPAMSAGKRIAPHTPYDIFVQIRSDRADVNHLVGTHICALLDDSVKLVEQVKGFRYLDGRDLTGFIDNSKNPHGAERRQIATVDESDFEFAGGSYIHIQRYRHLMAHWDETPTKAQEQIIGRFKASNKDFEPQEKSPTCHTRRTNLRTALGEPLKILRQSMPYGTMKIEGTFFISCCRDPMPFCQILKSMIKGDAHGNYDHLLNYTKAETGAAFFAPSIDFLRQYL